MNPFERWSLRIGAFAGITTGVGLGAVRYLGGREGEFGPEPSAALPFWQHAHVLAVPVLVFALGVAVAGHAKQLAAPFGRGRRSGLLLGVLGAPLVLGGAAVQVFTSAQLRAWAGWLHAAFGALFALLYLAHWSARASRQTRLPEVTAPTPLRRSALHFGRLRHLMMMVGLGILVGCDSALPEPGPVLTPGVDETVLSRRELLGKRLFEDRRLSEPTGQACASCHSAANAFTGNDDSPVAAVARGAPAGALGSRNVPTLLYASYSPPFQFLPDEEHHSPDGGVVFAPVGGQFWDGRAASLEAQALGPFLNPLEMNNPDAAAVVARVSDGPYAGLFAEVCGNQLADGVQPAFACVGSAIAAFERTDRFHPFSSRFDHVLAGDGAFTDLEAKGFEIFKDPQKGNCIACHVGDPTSRESESWLFTDFSYDNLGLPRNTDIPDTADPTFFDLGLCKQPGLSARAPAGFDLDSLCGAFKVPSLRNIERTAPYGHNGVFKELRDVVRFYSTRDTNPERWYPADGGLKLDDLPPQYQSNVNTDEVPYDRKPGEQPRLSDEDIDAIVAFLKTLTDQ